MIEIYRDEYGILCLEDGGDNGWFLHVEILKWSHNIFMKTLLRFEAIKEGMRERGLKNIRAYIPQNDRKHEKFATIYGFYPLELEFLHPETGVLNRIWEFNLEEY